MCSTDGHSHPDVTVAIELQKKEQAEAKPHVCCGRCKKREAETAAAQAEGRQ